MLSRVAESLYWMSRYVERAESIARLISVNHQILIDLDIRTAEQTRRSWMPLLTTLNLHTFFRKTGKEPTLENVTEFLIFDTTNPSSLCSCFRSARENARAVREQISTEMWEQLNRTYLWLWSKSAPQSFQRDLYVFLDQIRESSVLLHGLSNSTMLYEEGWDFVQLGRFVERADFISRMLDDKYHLIGKANPLIQWGGVLRSCSAEQAYQQCYTSEPQPTRVAEFLLLNDRFPRSVHFCSLQFDHALRQISGARQGVFTNDAEKISGRLLAELRFSGIDDYWRAGLHTVADEIQDKLNALHVAIAEAYFHTRNPKPITQSSVPSPRQLAGMDAQQ